MAEREPFRVALAQIAPVLLDREATLAKVCSAIGEAAAGGARLVAFGEALVPGYPVWLSRTDAARFDAEDQKELHALYAREAVQLEADHLAAVQEAARTGGIAVCLGVIERPLDRGGKSLYCSRVWIEPDGRIGSVHRKLVPTYEERLSWAPGDGAGLVAHPLGPFTVGALNCWENWMPMARAALYAAGVDLHIAIWPGAERNTRDITRFVALEGRSYVLSVSGLLRAEDVPPGFPQRTQVAGAPGTLLMDGGSCVAGPDGTWVLEPAVGVEQVLFCELDPARILGERQNFDPSGHYSRPDVLELRVDRRRQGTAHFRDA